MAQQHRVGCTSITRRHWSGCSGWWSSWVGPQCGVPVVWVGWGIISASIRTVLVGVVCDQTEDRRSRKWSKNFYLILVYPYQVCQHILKLITEKILGNQLKQFYTLQINTDMNNILLGNLTFKVCSEKQIIKCIFRDATATTL